MKNETKIALETWLKKQGFTKKYGHDCYLKNQVPNQRVVDLEIEPPFVGISSGIERQEAEVCSIGECIDIKNNVLRIYNENENPVSSAYPGKVKTIVDMKEVGTVIVNGEIMKPDSNTFIEKDKPKVEKSSLTIIDESKVYHNPEDKPKAKAEPEVTKDVMPKKEETVMPKKEAEMPKEEPEPEGKKKVTPMCSVCHYEITQSRALNQFEAGLDRKDWTCDDCGDKAKEINHKMHEESQKQEHNQGNNKGTETMNEPQTEKKEVPKKQESGFDLLEFIKSYVNNDVLEIFGDSGTGKSKFAVETARQAIVSGKSVYYLDTERNLSKEEVEKLKGCQYKYTPLISEISQITRSLPKVDLVIIDSIGFPILTAYARMNMKQKGDALLNMIAIFGDLKEWAYRNNAIAIVINQPESDFNKEPGHLIRPFGDKSQFAAKEIWKTEVTQRGAVTKTDVRAFRSRSVGHKTLIATMEVSDNGTEIKGKK